MVVSTTSTRSAAMVDEKSSSSLAFSKSLSFEFARVNVSRKTVVKALWLLSDLVSL